MKTMPYNLTIPTTSSIQTALQQSKTLTSVHDSNTVALTTGKRINSSYDNSMLFFKDMRLSEKAAELNSVLDGLSGIASTLNTTTNSIDAISDLLAQARAAANSAYDEANYLSRLSGGNFTVKTDTLLSDLPAVKAGDEILLRTGDADKMESQYVMERDATLADMGIETGAEMKIKIGDDDWITLTVIDDTMKVTDFLGQIYEQTPAERFQFDITNQKLTLSTTDRSSILIDGEMAEKLGFDLSSTHKITIGSDWTIQDLAFAFSDIDGISATVNSKGNFEVSSIYGDDLIIADLTGESSGSFGLEGCDDGGFNSKKSYADQYNELLKQINRAVSDSRYNGVNLLEGDLMRAIFNEKGTDLRIIKGVKLDTESMGMSDAVGDWQNKDDIQKALDDIDNAFYQIKQATNKFNRASMMVQSHDTYLESMSATCLNNAEKLTEADLNEAAMNILSAQTQKELVNQVISITMDSNASVLSLF